mgnify:CR=1 FL=1
MNFEWDEYGNPSPYDFIDATLEEMYQQFVSPFPNSKTREPIWEGFNAFLSDYSRKISKHLELWVDGSFITTKLNPADIDVAVIHAFTDKANRAMARMDQLHLDSLSGSKAKYRTDAYLFPIYPEADSRFSEANRKHALAKQIEIKGQFSFDRDNRPKGIIRLSLNSI